MTLSPAESVARQATASLIGAEGWITPDFQGRGLANIGSTVLETLVPGRSHSRLPGLAADVLPPELLRGVRHIVLVAVDGLGHHQLLRECAAGNAPALSDLLARAARHDSTVHYAPLTSVFPTTTVAALGSLNTGVPPAVHGLLGYSLYLPELEQVAEMIRWGPLTGRGSYSEQANGGLDPSEFLWSSTLYEEIKKESGVRAISVSARYLHGSSLSRMFHRGADFTGYAAPSSIASLVPRLIKSESSPAFVFAYLATLDTVAHAAGPLTPEHADEVAAVDTMINRLLSNLSGASDTLVLLTADHGHIDTDDSREVSLDNHPRLMALLTEMPAGERRAVYLHALPGKAEELARVAEDALGEVAVVLTREQAVAEGLFGPEPLSEQAAGRIGDVILLARGNRQIAFTVARTEEPKDRHPSAPHFRGIHGGLTPQEALVPLLAVRP